MHRQNEQLDKDNELADFADRLLGGGKDITASAADEELLGLEKTLLRLDRAFSDESLEEARAKQMLVRFKARVRREEEAAKPSIWKRLFDFQSNPQVGMILAVAMIFLLAVIFLPDSLPPGSSISGTASSGVDPFLLTGLFIVLSILYLISRRKK